jgi:hypothetical protein
VFGIHPVLALVAGDVRSVHVGRGIGDRGPGVAVVEVERTSVEVHETLGSLAAVDLVVAPRAVRDIEGLVAVRSFDARHFRRDFIERLVPGDADELTLAAPAGALHGIKEAVGMVLAAPIEAAADARAELGVLDPVGRAVVSLDADDLAVLDVDLEQATAAAVMRRAAGADHLDLGLRVLGCERDGGRGGEPTILAAGAALEEGGSAEEGAPAEERAALHRLRIDLFAKAGRAAHFFLLGSRL